MGIASTDTRMAKIPRAACTPVGTGMVDELGYPQTGWSQVHSLYTPVHCDLHHRLMRLVLTFIQLGIHLLRWTKPWTDMETGSVWHHISIFAFVRILLSPDWSKSRYKLNIEIGVKQEKEFGQKKKLVTGKKQPWCSWKVSFGHWDFMDKVHLCTVIKKRGKIL